MSGVPPLCCAWYIVFFTLRARLIFGLILHGLVPPGGVEGIVYVLGWNKYRIGLGLMKPMKVVIYVRVVDSDSTVNRAVQSHFLIKHTIHSRKEPYTE